MSSTLDKSSVDPLSFIRRNVVSGNVFWTYHVNMRMKDRFISRRMIIETSDNFEIIENYSEDKYLPSYLIYSEYDNIKFHVLIAIDEKNDNVRIVTSYIPDVNLWDKDLKVRKNI